MTSAANSATIARKAEQQGEHSMPKYTWDHVHLKTPDPEAMAQWFEKMLGAEVIRTMQEGKPRIDLKLGGANIFIAESPGHNEPPSIPYRGLEHFGLTVNDLDSVAAELKGKGVEFTKDVTRRARACASASSAARRAFRSRSSSASRCETGYFAIGGTAVADSLMALGAAKRLPGSRTGTVLPADLVDPAGDNSVKFVSAGTQSQIRIIARPLQNPRVVQISPCALD